MDGGRDSPKDKDTVEAVNHNSKHDLFNAGTLHKDHEDHIAGKERISC